MKTLVALIAVLLIVATVWWMSGDIQPDSVVRDTNDLYETDMRVSETVPETAEASPMELETALSAQQQDEANRARLQQTKSELDTLMLAYDANLNNPEKRQQIKREMDKLLSEYDELVLPVALEKMKNDKPSHGN